MAVKIQRETGRRLGEILLEKKWVTEEGMARVIADQAGVKFVDLRVFVVDRALAQNLPERDAKRLRVLLLERRQGKILLGMVDPYDLRASDEICRILGLQVDVAVITQKQYQQALERLYRKTDVIEELARDVERDLGVVDLYAMDEDATPEDAPVVRLLQTLFEEAVQQRASDIHIEPEEQELRIRYRVDGVLRIQSIIDPRIAAPLLVRVKLLAAMDIAERRLPQDGRISLKTHSERIDVRVSTVPTQTGESAVMRLLMQSGAVRKLEDAGMPADVLETFRKLISSPNGMVLVTGPTGSGKTTTLYGALGQLNQPGVKILTCEDPVEYVLEGLVQVQVNERIDLGFARIMRSFLRQDPDIILVGEVRDPETAEIAARASLTGHLILSTLHTNDSISAANRLADLGLPHFMVASTLRGIVAQRLLRRICDGCAEAYIPNGAERAWLSHHFGAAMADAEFKAGIGCVKCDGSGFFGRQGIYEILTITPALAIALQQADKVAFEAAARAQLKGRTLAREAANLVLNGITTAAEAMRVVALDE